MKTLAIYVKRTLSMDPLQFFPYRPGETKSITKEYHDMNIVHILMGDYVELSSHKIQWLNRNPYVTAFDIFGPNPYY